MARIPSFPNSRTSRHLGATAALVVGALLALAACGGPAEGPAPSGGEASGGDATLRVAAVFETPMSFSQAVKVE